MKIILKDEDVIVDYIVTEEVTRQLIEFLFNKIYTIYEKTPNTLQMAVTLFARNELLNLEKKYPEKKEAFRPPKRVDPVKHVLHLAKGVFAELLKEEKINVQANSNGEIYSLELKNPSTSGGQVALSGNEWERQDNGGEVSR